MLGILVTKTKVIKHRSEDHNTKNTGRELYNDAIAIHMQHEGNKEKKTSQ